MNPLHPASRALPTEVRDCPLNKQKTRVTLFFRLFFILMLTLCAILAINQQEKMQRLSLTPADQSSIILPANNTTVHLSNQVAPLANTSNIPKQHMINALKASFAAAITAWLACLIIIRYQHLHAHFSLDHINNSPQKYHAHPTTRIGGIALVIGMISGGFTFYLSQDRFPLTEFVLLLLVAIPAFAGGLLEDITKRVGVAERLLLTMISAALAAWLLDAVLTRAGIPGLHEALTWVPFAIIFTIFAIGGVANAINIIDGYNGLSAGYALITLAALAWIAAQAGDGIIFFCALAMAGALLGFFIWNWPLGKIFLGDGGAYLLGFWMAEICVLLVVRNPLLQPRLFLALMIYPVFETLFTVYRRKILQKQSPGSPDNMHLHQLIYKYRATKAPITDCPNERTRQNSAIAPIILSVCGLFTLTTLNYWQSASGLVFVVMAFCMAYVWGYFHLLNRINRHNQQPE